MYKIVGWQVRVWSPFMNKWMPVPHMKIEDLRGMQFRDSTKS